MAGAFTKQTIPSTGPQVVEEAEPRTAGRIVVDGVVPTKKEQLKDAIWPGVRSFVLDGLLRMYLILATGAIVYWLAFSATGTTPFGYFVFSVIALQALVIITLLFAYYAADACSQTCDQELWTKMSFDATVAGRPYNWEKGYIDKTWFVGSCRPAFMPMKRVYPDGSTEVVKTVKTPGRLKLFTVSEPIPHIGVLLVLNRMCVSDVLPPEYCDEMFNPRYGQQWVTVIYTTGKKKTFYYKGKLAADTPEGWLDADDDAKMRDCASPVYLWFHGQLPPVASSVKQ